MNDVALIGYGCRLPGAEGPDAFWSLLMGERPAIGVIGPDRWSASTLLNHDPAAFGRSYTLAAGVLDDPFGFDAGFFGVSPREAAQLDPQQRLILTVAWEALEHAGLPPAALAGPRAGVFMGASGLDYGTALGASDIDALDAQFMTGNTLSIIANRLSHLLDAQGPSYVVDTACSSALYALHAAMRALEAGEIDFALVGGVNMLLSPAPFIGFSRAGMLSRAGRCRPFDAAADGYVRAEGAVVTVLARAGAARDAGCRARAMVAASAINSDGRVGTLSIPNGARQEALMRAALARAGLSPADLAFVEAHGTGTPVGDPIETAAIGATLGQGRAAPLPVGSAKGHVGHLEPASGLVGLVKAAMALERGVLPGTAGLETLNPDIDFDALNIAPSSAPRAIGPGAALVNSFGFGGANACAVLRAPEADAPVADAPEAAAPRADAPLLLSAADETALRALAGRWADRLEAAPQDEAALVNIAAHRRARHARRLVVPAQGADRVATLRAVAAGEAPEQAALAASALPAPGPVAFLFSGNGSQWAGMGREAMADPAFRAGFDAVAEATLDAGGPDPREALAAPDLDALLSEALTAQPLLLALHMGVVDMLAARGITPDAVAGHSVGEVSAACCAGAITRAEAARLAVGRARRQTPLFGRGAMAAALVGAEEMAAFLAESGVEGVTISADNSPRSITVTAEPEALDALIRAGRARRVAMRRLRVDYPFHGPLMEEIRDALMEELAWLAPRDAAIPMVSTALGGVVEGAALDAAHWWRNAREPVLFRQAALALHDLGARAFVEISPQPSLQNYVADTLAAEGRAHVALSTLRRSGARREDGDMIAAAIAAAGARLDEARYFGPVAPVSVEAPRYPWSRRAHQPTPTPERVNALRRAAPRPFLGWRPTPHSDEWRLALDAATPAWLGDHRVEGEAATPAAGFVELALAAGAEALGAGALELRDFDILRALPLGPGARAVIRTRFDRETGALRIESRPHLADEAWTLHAAGTVRRAAASAPDAAPARAPADAPDAALYAGLERLGLDYGPAFRRLGRPEPDGEAGATAALTPSLLADAGAWLLDPTDLDAAFHALAALLRDAAPTPHVPVRIGRLILHAPGRATASCRARLLRRGARGVEAAFDLRDAGGGAVASLSGVRFMALRRAGRVEPEALFWRERRIALRAPGAAAQPPAPWRAPAARLAALGLPRSPGPREEAAALILDAAARRPEGGAEAGGPAPEALIEALAAEAPDHGAALLALASRAAGEEAAPAPSGAFWDDLLAAGRDVAASRAPGASLAALLVGAAPAAQARALALDCDRFACVARIDDAPDGEGFDLALIGPAVSGSAERLAAALAPGALALFAAAPGDEGEALRAAGFDAVERVGPAQGAALLVACAPDAARIGATELTPAPRLAAFGALAPALAARLTARGRRAVALERLDDLAEGDALALDLTPAPGAEGVSAALERLRAALAARPSAIWALIAGERDEPEAEAVARALRAIANERAEPPLWALRHDPALPTERAAALLAAEIDAAAAERALWFDAQGRAARRVEPAGDVAARARAALLDGAAAPALTPDPGRGLDGLAWRPAARRAPGPGEVEIEIAAAGLNFRDVMWAMGALPEEAIEDGFAGTGIGMECAGRVARAGAGAGLAVGARVIAFAPQACAGFATIRADWAAEIPQALPLEDAATLPVAFATAWRGLVDLGQLGAGDCVLIHGGAGGVGLAALQIAQDRGARVFATAGTPGKRLLLKALGAERVFDSRSLDFADAVMEASGGAGVDVVLNSLAGEAMERSLACLKPFGRFIELGKRDFYANTRVGLRPLRRNIGYFGVDLDALLAARPESAAPLLKAVADGAEAGRFLPLPYRRFAALEAAEAFRLMQKSGHVGKIVIAAPDPLPPAPSAPAPIRAEASYLVLGGLGGFGLAYAERLVARGARTLWLTSRRGRAEGEAAAALARMRAAGARVEVLAFDVANEPALKAALERIASEGPPLRGVAHAAMALDDALFDSLDAARIAAQLRPKLDGARALDRLTRGLDLDFFVLFSSVAAMLGNPGQSAYVAGNAALEAIARGRRAAGLPALAAGFGPIRDVGVLAGDAEAQARLARKGAGALDAAEALDALEIALAGQGPQDAALVLAPMRWGRMRGDVAALDTPLFEALDLSESGEAAAAALDLRALIAGLDNAAAARKVADLFRADAAGILRMEAGEIDIDRPLPEFGFDSLMAVEFKFIAEEKYGLSLPSFAMSDGSTLATLAARVVAQLRGAGPAGEPEEALAERHLDEADMARLREARAAEGGG